MHHHHPAGWQLTALISFETLLELQGAEAARALQEVKGQGGRVLLAMADHGHMPGNPGWLLRNALLLAAVTFGQTEVEVAAIRLRRGRASLQNSLLLSALLPGSPPGLLLLKSLLWLLFFALPMQPGRKAY